MSKKKPTYKNSLPNTWDSGLVEVERDIIVPMHLQRILESIQDNNNNNEFTILVKGKWQDEGFILTTDYYIPKQKVTGASVDYLENLRPLREEEDYNVLIHSHPFAAQTSYSAPDEDTANTHFDAALLLNGDNKLICGKIKINLPDNRIIKVDMDIVLEYTLPEIDTKHINEKETKVYSGYNQRENNYYRGGYLYYDGNGKSIQDKIDAIDEENMSEEKYEKKVNEVVNDHYMI